MKKTAALFCLLAAPFALADSINDELMSAQAAYRDALKVQNHSGGRIASLQSGIAFEQKRIKQAEADIAKMQAQLQEETARKAQADSALQAAGARLDAAWQARKAKTNP